MGQHRRLTFCPLKMKIFDTLCLTGLPRDARQDHRRTMKQTNGAPIWPKQVRTGGLEVLCTEHVKYLQALANRSMDPIRLKENLNAT